MITWGPDSIKFEKPINLTDKMWGLALLVNVSYVAAVWGILRLIYGG